MNATMTREQRLFAPFLDPVDMVMCCPAATSLAQVNDMAARHGLRFPLACDPATSLQDHVTAVDYAPGSARFGPYVDNILGMNWELPSGTVVRVGERVIKSTTGYDLLRFLLHSNGRFGRAHDYVLRLRPAGGKTARVVLRGDNEGIERARDAILHSPWVHWLDVVDLLFTRERGVALEISADCATGEVDLYYNFFTQLGRESDGAVLAPTESRRQALPALSLKTTVTEAPRMARELVRNYGGSARVLCVNGVIHYHPPPELQSLPDTTLQTLAQQCTVKGGHVSGLWAKEPLSAPQEAAWANELETAWNQL
jgi:hypothetical protein